MTQPSDSAARLVAAAALLGFDVQSTIEQLVAVASGFAHATAFVDADLAAFAIGVELPSDDWSARRMAMLASGISPSRALSRAIIARAGAPWIECGVGSGGTMAAGLAGVHATLALAGVETRDADLTAAAAIGLAAATCDALRSRLDLLGDDGGARQRALRVTVFSGESPHNFVVELGAPARADLLERIDAHADALGIGLAQRKLLGRIHPILAKAAPVWIRVAACVGEVVPGATLSYGAVPLDTALRVINGLANDPDRATARFGTLTGALAAGQALRGLDLALGSREPMPARLALGLV